MGGSTAEGARRAIATRALQLAGASPRLLVPKERCAIGSARRSP